MALQTAQTASIIKKFRRGELDTGSPEVQVALLTTRISELTEHFKRNTNDVHSRQGMFKLVSRRRKLLNYLQRTAPDRYVKIIEELSLRK